MIDIRVVTVYELHYPDETPESAQQRDYDGIEIYVNGVLFREYGDAYHCEGAAKAEGWVEGFTYGSSKKTYKIRRGVKVYKPAGWE